MSLTIVVLTSTTCSDKWTHGSLSPIVIGSCMTRVEQVSDDDISRAKAAREELLRNKLAIVKKTRDDVMRKIRIALARHLGIPERVMIFLLARVHSGGGVEKPGGWRFSPLVLYDLGGTLATADRRGDRPGCSKVRRACCNGWLGEQWHGPRLLTRVRP